MTQPRDPAGPAGTAGAGPPVPAPVKPGVRPLAGLLTATLLALTGTRVSAVALPWFALVTTGSPALTGLVVFCEMAPYVAAKALSGPVVDRVGTRLTSWTTDLASALVAGLVPLCYLLDALPFWLLLVLVALLGTVRGPADLAKQVMVPEAADRCAVPLERATGLSGAAERFAATVGPLVGGGLIALVGPAAGLVVNGVCFLLCAVLVTTVLPAGMGRRVPDEATAGDTAPSHPEGYWRQLRGGLSFLLRERLLLVLTLTICVTNLLDAAFASVLLPVWAERNGGPMAIAWIGATMGATAIAGSVVASAAGHRLPRFPVFVAGFLLIGPPRMLILATGAPLWLVLVVVGIGGFGGGFVNPVVGAISFERIPRPMLGRVTSLSTSVAWAGIPLGGLLGGLAVGAMGLTSVLVLASVGYALTIALAARHPAMSTINERPVRTPAGGGAGPDGEPSADPGHDGPSDASRTPAPRGTAPRGVSQPPRAPDPS